MHHRNRISRRLPNALLTVAAMAGLFVLTGAPNNRPHDHIGNFSFTIDIEGVQAGYVLAVEYTPTNGCPVVDVERDTFAAQVERRFEAAVAANNDAMANATGTLSNALLKRDTRTVPLFREGASDAGCEYSMGALPSARILLRGDAG